MFPAITPDSSQLQLGRDPEGRRKAEYGEGRLAPPGVWTWEKAVNLPQKRFYHLKWHVLVHSECIFVCAVTH